MSAASDGAQPGRVQATVVRKRSAICGEAGCYLPADHVGCCAFIELLPEPKKRFKVDEVTREARLAGYGEVLQMLEARAAEKAMAATAAPISAMWDTTMSESSDDQRDQAHELALVVEQVASDPARAWSPDTAPSPQCAAAISEPPSVLPTDAKAPPTDAEAPSSDGEAPSTDAEAPGAAVSFAGEKPSSSPPQRLACGEEPSSELPRPPKRKKTVRWLLPEKETMREVVAGATVLPNSSAGTDRSVGTNASGQMSAGSGQRVLASMSLMTGSRSKEHGAHEGGYDWAF